MDFSTYDYRRAARDALHFSKLVDRFVQNLRQAKSCPHGTRRWMNSTTIPKRNPITWSGSVDRSMPREVVAGSADADRCVRYLAKYLTKDIAECHAAETVRQEQHVDRLLDALRFEPCSSRCSNWLRYGIQPENAKAGMRPGFCRSKAHRREYLGYAGRRVLVSRKWSGKTLADHKADRLAWVLDALGIDPTNDDGQGDEDNPRPALLSVASGSFAWELARPTDPDVAPREQRLLRAVGEALKRRAQLDAARQTDLSATPEARVA